jgi:16S rRNA (guanine966-N2)-methyltransferase
MRIGAGRFKGRALPAARGARPVPGRLRTSLFSVLASRIEGARVLDLFAGVGGLGLEALSRGASSVVLVERDRRTAEDLVRWIEEAGVASEARVVVGDVASVAVPAGPYDLVFLDPPFALWDGPSGTALLVRAVTLLAPEGLVAAKIPSRLQTPEDPAFEAVKRADMGTVSYVVLAARRARNGVKRAGRRADPGDSGRGPSTGGDEVR